MTAKRQFSRSIRIDGKIGEDMGQKNQEVIVESDEDIIIAEVNTTGKFVWTQLNRTDAEENELTHKPFRSWCEHCNTGMGSK